MRYAGRQQRRRKLRHPPRRASRLYVRCWERQRHPPGEGGRAAVRQLLDGQSPASATLLGEEGASRPFSLVAKLPGIPISVPSGVPSWPQLRNSSVPFSVIRPTSTPTKITGRPFDRCRAARRTRATIKNVSVYCCCVDSTASCGSSFGI